MRRDEAILPDIVQAVRSALDFMAVMTKEAFLDDRKTQSAVLHQLTVPGEAVKRLSPDFRARYSGIPPDTHRRYA
jgi:uncharacterized protein with HEPN domain